MREACWHFCPRCKRDWCHSVSAKALVTDNYFMWCTPCVLRHGFDAVDLTTRRATREADDGEVEFSLLLPPAEEN